MNEKITYKYAKALYEIGEKHHKQLKIFSEFKILVEIFINDILNFFVNPNIDKNEKKYIISHILEKYDFSDDSIAFIYILINNNRMKLFPLIYKKFLQIKDEKEFLIRGRIVTTNLASEDIVSEITDFFNNIIKRKIDWKHICDNSILGGFKVKIGDKLFDASLQKNLNDIHKKIIS